LAYFATLAWCFAAPGGGETVQGEGYVRHSATHPKSPERGIGSSLLARCFIDAQPLIHTLHCFSTLNAGLRLRTASPSSR